MKKEMADMWIRFFTSTGQTKILEFLKRKMEQKGTKTNVATEELYTMPITFNTDEVISLDDFAKAKPKDQIDFSNLSDEKMWGLIYGMLTHGNTQSLHGIGAILIKHY